MFGACLDVRCGGTKSKWVQLCAAALFLRTDCIHEPCVLVCLFSSRM